MDVHEAQKVIESLRKGIPPDGFVRAFTVGRANEIDELSQKLRSGEAGALLLLANYGSGKTHLLRFIRETALQNGYVVSLITLDSRANVRFNRMDQVFGAICRNLEIPEATSHKGIRGLFDSVCAKSRDRGIPDLPFLNRLTNEGKWDYSEVLDSPGMFVALRAWCTGEPRVQDLVEDWMFQPWLYKTQRKKLFGSLVESLRPYFRDPRPDWKFYADGVFVFDAQGYAQCWAGLRDMQRLARACGYAGFVILFDEYEDVVTNMRNVGHQESAFWNLFQFYSGKSFPGMTFYAVTPEFVSKCKTVLLQKGRFDFDYDLFDRIPTYQMSPLEADELFELGGRIAESHGAAYRWQPFGAIHRDDFAGIVYESANAPIQDRARQTIRRIVMYLDAKLEECE